MRKMTLSLAAGGTIFIRLGRMSAGNIFSKVAYYIIYNITINITMQNTRILRNAPECWFDVLDKELGVRS